MVTEPRPVRFGYVGCGFMAQKVHLPNFSRIPGCELIALAEVRAGLRDRVADRYGVSRRYSSHEEIARDPEIEAVGVSAGYALQGQMARDLLRAGKHVFMEKPMAVSIAAAEEILAASRAGGGRLMVAYMKRYDAGNEAAKAAIDRFRLNGELGVVTYARNHGFCGDWIQNLDAPMERDPEPQPPSPEVGPEWMPKPHVASYLGYLQQYTHNLNLLRWFLDGDATNCRVRAVDLRDGYSGIVSLEINGVQAVLESGSLSYWGWEEHTQVYFRDGWVRVDAPALLHKDRPAEVEIYRGGKVQSYERPLGQPIWSWSYQREAEHFIEQVRANQPFRSSGEDTLADVRLFEEIYRAYLLAQGTVEYESGDQ
jgi:predicted dehydrogenase